MPNMGLTAQAFSEQIAEWCAAGMNGHLGKPFIPESLLHAARLILDDLSHRTDLSREALDTTLAKLEHEYLRIVMSEQQGGLKPKPTTAKSFTVPASRSRPSPTP